MSSSERFNTSDILYNDSQRTIQELRKENQRLQQSIKDWISGEQGRKLREENQRLRGVVEVLQDNMTQAFGYMAQCPECDLLLPKHDEGCALRDAMERGTK